MFLEPEKAAEILSLLPEEMKADIALRIVKIGQVQDDLIRELDETIKKDLSKIGIATRDFDGVETLANILNVMDGKTEEYLLSHIEEDDVDLAEKIRQKIKDEKIKGYHPHPIHFVLGDCLPGLNYLPCLHSKETCSSLTQNCGSG